MSGRGEAILAMYIGQLSDRLTFAMDVLADQIQESIATLYPPSSAPDNPPHRRTGRLWRSVKAHEAELKGTTLVGAVGVSTPYAEDLEFGRARVAARPFMRPGLHNNAENIRRILSE